MSLTPPQDALGFEDEFTFTVFYQPGENDVDRISRQVLIESNARTPSFFVNLVGEPCIRMTPSDVCGLCGDGEVNPGEECDDGNLNPADDCTNTCTLPICGDNVVQGDEECDDGNTNDNDPCTNDCKHAICGDGIVFDGFEACDDGNDIDDDSCSNTCQSAGCGDGIVQDGEACDDGNDDNTDGCTTDCIVVSCGDGVTQGDETCDDGNQITENCAYGEISCMVCDATCNLAPGSTSFCGDTITNEAAGETCDDGNLALEVCDYGLQSCMVCDPNCRLQAGATSYCGDGVIDDANGETCEPSMMQAMSPDTCDFLSSVNYFGSVNEVPPQAENKIFIVDVNGISDAQKDTLIAQAHLVNYESSFSLNAVTDIGAASIEGNIHTSREYLIVADLTDDFYAPGGTGAFSDAFQINNTTSAGGSNYTSVSFDVQTTALGRKIAVAFAPIDMFINSHYTSATISTFIADGTRVYAKNADGDDLVLTYNYDINNDCAALAQSTRCIPAGEPNQCTLENVDPVDPCDAPMPPPECNEGSSYDGRYVLNPIIQHQCNSILGNRIVDIALSQLVFTESGDTLLIESYSQTDMPALSQMPRPEDGSFSATATIQGGCREDFVLTGTFSDASRTDWTGNLELCFTQTDGISCQLTTDCQGGCFDYPVSGVE